MTNRFLWAEDDINVDDDEDKKYANAFEPTEAMKAFENRAWLIRDVIGADLQKQVRNELMKHLEGGRTLGQTISNIRQLFAPFVGDPTKIRRRSGRNLLQAYRIENIVRTESTWAYNQGRVAIGDAAGDYILGYQYSAVMDERTTDICRTADGLVMRKDAQSTQQLCPPNHFQCRSIFVFVTKDDMPVKWSTQRQVNRAVQMVQKGFR